MILQNTLSREREEFTPIDEKEVKIYSCGPTVYNYAHIGNFRAFMCSDLLKRYLKYKGYKVMHVMNITDVEDKIIRDSQKEGVGWKEFTERYTKHFIDDLQTLGIQLADVMPKATDHIPEMVEITKKLLEAGYAYKARDGIYYNIRKFPGYGEFAGIDIEASKAGASGRIAKDEYDKDNAQDFALWKFWDENDGDIFWETELGKGRPGWHIECSAMAMKYLGPHFDIHTGGIDLVFPHHQNEIAQSEAYSGRKFVNCWLHNDYILVEGKKMSKSLGNFFTLRDVLAKGYKPKAIRHLLLSAHYRQQLNFTFDALHASQKAVERLQELVSKLQDTDEGNDNERVSVLVTDCREGFSKALDDDLNISQAFAVLFDFVREMNTIIAEGALSKDNALEALQFLRQLDTVTAIIDWEDQEIDDATMALLKERNHARKEKDWKRSDELRDEIARKGYAVDDTPTGTKIKRI
jgi:cysteinyl-tRNA synthetase